jgi:hypothetical protein
MEFKHIAIENRTLSTTNMGVGKGQRDVPRGPPLLDQPREPLPIGDIGRLQPYPILEQRHLQCRRIVARRYDRARQRLDASGLLGQPATLFCALPASMYVKTARPLILARKYRTY